MILDVAFGVDQVRVSPDGKWVAYTSFESGEPEINVAAFPSFTDRRQISDGTGPGAVQPLWRGDGRELFFLGRDRETDGRGRCAGSHTCETGPVRKLFESSLNPSSQVHFYAVTRDGKRFLVRERRRIRTHAERTALHRHKLDFAREMNRTMTRSLFAGLLSAIAVSAALRADANYPTGTRGLLLIDKVGSYIRFFDPVTFKERSSIAVATKPHDFVLTADRKTAYVPLYGDGIFGTAIRIRAMKSPSSTWTRPK